MRFAFSLSYVFCCMLLILAACKHDIPEGPPGNGGNGTTNPTNPCYPDTVYFTRTILPLLVSRCAIPGCHDPGSAQDGVILNNYENIISTGDVRPFNPNGSDLYEVITDNDPDDRMPPSPNAALSASEISLIRTWIMQGALNNSCAADCDTTNVTYNLSIKPIITSKCQGCHSGASPQGGIALTNYAQVSTQALFGELLNAVQHTGGASPMPFNSAKMPDCEIDLIRIWIENGAPE